MKTVLDVISYPLPFSPFNPLLFNNSHLAPQIVRAREGRKEVRVEHHVHHVRHGTGVTLFEP
jgi:hypothetical protein